jgi:hypothetical protein
MNRKMQLFARAGQCATFGVLGTQIQLHGCAVVVPNNDWEIFARDAAGGGYSRVPGSVAPGPGRLVLALGADLIVAVMHAGGNTSAPSALVVDASCVGGGSRRRIRSCDDDYRNATRLERIERIERDVLAR